MINGRMNIQSMSRMRWTRSQVSLPAPAALKNVSNGFRIFRGPPPEMVLYLRIYSKLSFFRDGDGWNLGMVDYGEKIIIQLKK